MIGYVIAFVAGGFVGFMCMALFRMAGDEDKKVEIVYDDEPIRKLEVITKSVTRPVLDLHYTKSIYREDFDRFVDGELQNMVYEGLREQILPALNIEVHKDFRKMLYIVDGSIYVVAGEGIKEVDHND